MEIYCDGGVVRDIPYIVIAIKPKIGKVTGHIKRIHPGLGSYEAEAEAIREACRVAEIGDTIITDHQGLYTILNDPALIRNANAKLWQRKERSHFYESVAQDIRLKSLSFRWVNRGENYAGHVGTRLAAKIKYREITDDTLPMLEKIPIEKLKCDDQERTDTRYKIAKYIFRFARWVRG
ncbi:MAG: hypothetical protein PHS46_08590 [Candidatus Omnitrophica bacterium]|nr:hypothetical protein [Candidatus Omnitrophota bacterium]